MDFYFASVFFLGELNLKLPSLKITRPDDTHGTFFFSVRSGWLASDVATLRLPEGCSWESCHFNAGDVAPWFPSVLFFPTSGFGNLVRVEAGT